MAWDEEVDVVVAGSGAAGLAAGIELADAALDVIVFEKQPTIEDTSTALSEGAFSFAGTDIQQRMGIEDSDDLLHQDLMAAGGQKSDEKLVRAYVENQLDTFHWLNGFGVKWVTVEAGAGMSVPRAHVTDPVEMLNLMKSAAESKGVRLIFKTRVAELIQDVEGVVAGVKVEGVIGIRRIKVRKGVVLATGGFGRDVKRLAAIDPRFAEVVPVVGPGHSGDGHRMAEKLGAYLIDMEYVKPTFGISATSPSHVTFSVMFYNGAVIVNKEGRRFIDESASYKEIGQAALGQPDGIGYQIFDQKIYEIGVGKARGMRPEKAMFGLDETRKKLLAKGDTIPELASKINVPYDALQQTINEYNEQAAAGKELRFGRSALAGKSGKILRIEEPPFFAYASKGMLPGTYGGIVVDASMRVQCRRGWIPGLFAAGEIVGGFHGVGYMTGTAAGKALIFGRIAGREAAKRN
ncbi:MAG: FAD-dependent oxidoreductase [Desulfobacterales bacterium]|nr:MAG: FAD-dependent oxidoreductase [Desulfobacterales bacterium]